MAISISLKVVLPKQKFADKKWVDSIANAMKKKTAPTLKKYFRDTVYGWSAKKKPSFRQKLTRSNQFISMFVYTDSEIYALVNAGSPPHPIPARPGGILRYKPGYRASTSPGVLKSRRAYRSGAYRIAKLIKKHPGFKARNFDEMIAKEYEPQFIEDMQDAVNGVAVGHLLF